MRSSDDTIEVQLWIARAVNPFRFKAVAELEAGLGVGLRNGFIKQLAEVGLIVHEERMRREPGVSTRTAGGLTAALGEHLSGSDSAITAGSTPAIRPGPVISPARLAEPLARSEHTGRKPAEEAVSGSSARPVNVAPVTANVEMTVPNDDARSPSRVSGSGPRRMLGGYASE